MAERSRWWPRRRRCSGGRQIWPLSVGFGQTHLQWLVTREEVALRDGGMFVAGGVQTSGVLCMGVVVVAAPGVNLADVSWPAAVAPVGVAILLGGVVEEICASSTLGSRSSDETHDPIVGLGGGGVSNVLYPLWGAILEILVPFVLPAGWTCTTSCLTGGEVGVALRLVWQ